MAQRMGHGTRDGRTDTGIVLGAAAAGLVAGLAANAGRKLVVQAVSGVSGDWFEALKTEHRMVMALFDKLEQTREDQKTKRTTLLTQIKHALAKHAFEEEMVVYPALSEIDREHADRLNHDHQGIKTYLYELETMNRDDPRWLARATELRRHIERHVREEEDEIFPSFRSRMSQDQNAKLTMMMNKEGLKLA